MTCSVYILEAPTHNDLHGRVETNLYICIYIHTYRFQALKPTFLGPTTSSLPHHTILPYRLASFWKAMDGTDWLASHPIQAREGYQSKAIPLRIFGDAVAVLGLAKSWGRSLECITLGSYLNSGSTQLSHLIFTLVWKGKRHEGTMKRVFRILKWSLQALYDGVYPSQNWDGSMWAQDSWESSMAGQPLAAGYYGVVIVKIPVAWET